MIFERFLQNSKKDEIIAILDIGSGSVGGALVSYPINKNPKILYSVRAPIIFYDKFNYERFFKSTLLTIKKILQILYNESLKTGNPKQIFYILAAPWYVSQSKNIVFEDSNTFLTTREKIDTIIADQVKNLKIKINTVYENFTNDNMRTIEINNLQIKLNGYKTNAPYNKKINKLEANLYLSVSTQEILQSFQQITKNIFGTNRIFFNSFSLATFITMRDLYSEKQNFLLIDISGEATEISIISNGILVETFSFSLGKNFLLRTIASEMQITKEEAISLFVLFMEEKITTEKKSQIQKALEYVAIEWSEVFYKKIQSSSEYKILPSLFFVVADTLFAQWFVTVIKNKKPTADILFTTQFIDVILINSLVLSKFVTIENQIKKDTFLLLEALFVNRLIKSEI